MDVKKTREQKKLIARKIHENADRLGKLAVGEHHPAQAGGRRINLSVRRTCVLGAFFFYTSFTFALYL